MTKQTIKECPKCEGTTVIAQNYNSSMFYDIDCEYEDEYGNYCKDGYLVNDGVIDE